MPTKETEAAVPFAVPHGEEHPSWSWHAYLCGACGDVSYAEQWPAFKYDDEGEHMLPAEAGSDEACATPDGWRETPLVKAILAARDSLALLEPRQDQPVDRASGERRNVFAALLTAVESMADGERVPALVDAGRKTLDAWPEHPETGEREPRAFTSRSACSKCGSHERDFNTERCLGCEPLQDGGERREVEFKALADHLREALGFMRSCARSGENGADHSTVISTIEAYEGFDFSARRPHQDVEREAELRLDLAQLAECDLPLVDCPPCQERASRLGAALGGTQ